MKRYFSPVYGFNDKERWIVMELMDVSLDLVYTDQRNARKTLLTDVAKAW
jgi:hypothetical protein